MQPTSAVVVGRCGEPAPEVGGLLRLADPRGDLPVVSLGARPSQRLSWVRLPRENPRMGWADGSEWRHLAPTFSELEYYSRLQRNEFSFSQTMRAHTQDLARSVGCRGLRELQLAALVDARMAASFDDVDAAELQAVIEDELPSPGRRSHFDVRAQMFEGTGVGPDCLDRVIALAATSAGITVFCQLFESGSLLEMTAAVGAIESWYVDVARRLERLYLALGYSDTQVETYALHAQADVWHSTAALSFVDKYVTPSEHAGVVRAVNDGFRSVRLLDEGRLEAANTPGTLLDLFTGSAA